jgi:hypothetical protein
MPYVVTIDKERESVMTPTKAKMEECKRHISRAIEYHSDLNNTCNGNLLIILKKNNTISKSTAYLPLQCPYIPQRIEVEYFDIAFDLFCGAILCPYVSR